VDLDKVLSEILAARTATPKQGYGSGSGLVRPKELDAPETPAELRNSIRSAYCAALTDQPMTLLSDIEKATLKEEISLVLQKDGFKS
jgi:hypothetical protein